MKLLSKLKIKKLNSKGVAHHALIAFLVVTAIASFGAYRVFWSSAATQYSIGISEERTVNNISVTGCYLSGRVYKADAPDGQKCKDTCRVDSAVFVPRDNAKDRPGYCKGYVALEGDNTTEDICVNNQHRWWIKNLGCARKADQENANDAKRLCPNPDYPNYKAEATIDKCIAPDLVNTGKDTPGSDGTNPPTPNNPSQPTDKMAKGTCDLLGRTWNSSANACNQVCAADAGALLQLNDVKYCQRAVATNATEARCGELHRKWLGAGCARRIDQTVDADNAPQCVGMVGNVNYKYYNVNFKPKNGEATLTDVCETDANAAHEHEQQGILGGVQVGSTKPGDTTPGPTDQCPTNNGQNARCIPPVGGNPGTPGPEGTTYKITLFKNKDFKGDSMEVTSTVNNNTVVLKAKINGKDSADIHDLAKMPKGWNDKVSSFKVQSGQWQLCPEADYLGSKKVKCANTYAGDPELGDKLKDAISSVRLVTNTSYSEILNDGTVEDIPQPSCGVDANGVSVQLGEDGKCANGQDPTCPADFEGLVVGYNDGECQLKIVDADSMVPVDKRFKGKDGKKQCELLGREWIEKAGKKETNNGEYGCSTVTCRLNSDGRPRKVKSDENGGRPVVPNDNDGDTTPAVCLSYKSDAPYAVKMDSVKVDDDKGKGLSDSQDKCKALGRVWISQVKLCAQVPNRKDKNQTIVNSDRCASNKKDTYYIFKEAAKTDQCFKPSYFDSAKVVAKSTGGALSSALKQGPKAYCAVVKGGKYHWQDGKCVIDRHKCWNGQSLPVGQKCPQKPDNGSGGSGGGVEQGQGKETAPNGKSWADFCAYYGRKSTAMGCSTDCIQTTQVKNPGRTGAYGYDFCDRKEYVCSSYQTGGTKKCEEQAYTAVYNCNKAKTFWTFSGYCSEPRGCTGWHTKDIELEFKPNLYKVTNVGFCDSFTDPHL